MEAQVEINGIPEFPVYPLPQTPGLIFNNNLEALDLEGNIHAAVYPGLQWLATWTKYGFLQAISFEHRDTWKSRIISGYPNPTSNLLNINNRTPFNASNSNDVFILAYAERVAKANFSGSSASIEY
jgi:hypothetical protein